MKKKVVNIDPRFVEAVRAMKGDEPILAIDTGNKCGVALLIGDVVASRTCEPDEVASAISSAAAELDLTLGDLRSSLYTREAPYTVSNKALETGRANAGALWMHGYNAGIVDTRVLMMLGPLTTWTPAASTWRSTLGLNRGVDGKRTRDEVNEAVWMWACATKRSTLTSQRGARLLDEANAICMAYATRTVRNALRRKK